MDTVRPSRVEAGQKYRRPLLSHFLIDRKGSTAIEFGMLAIPFFLLIFAILESCISFAGQQLLSLATDKVGRQIRTGQIRAADVKADPEMIRRLICNEIEIIVAAGCPGLEIDLRNYPTFADAAKERIVFTGGDIDTSGFKIDPGLSMSKNMLRTFYRWPVMTDFMRKSMSNLNDGKTLHFATVTWQNEPFDD